MAAAGARLARVSSRLPSLLLRSRSRAPSPDFALAAPSPGHVARLPSRVRCLASMMPLHTAIASSRLISVLSAESQSWGLIPQGAISYALSYLKSLITSAVPEPIIGNGTNCGET